MKLKYRFFNWLTDKKIEITEANKLKLPEMTKRDKEIQRLGGILILIGGLIILLST